MTESISHIPKPGTEPLRNEPMRKAQAGLFDDLLGVGQADVLMRQTDQYAQWQRIGQKDDAEVQRIAELILTRDTYLQEKAQGNAVDWQHFDRITGKLRLAGIDLPTAGKIASDKQTSSSPVSPLTPSSTTHVVQDVSPSLSGPLLNEENLLILSMLSPEIGLNETVFGYGDQQTTQLPLGEIASILDFSISVDAESGSAKGWFISEDRTFELDATNRRIDINGETYPWDDGRISVGEGDIFVDSRVLSEWFPVDFEVSHGELSVTLAPREMLPLQARYEREQRRLGLLGREDMSLKYPTSPTPYELFSFPVMDFAMSGGIGTVSQDSADFQSRYSIVAEMDLAYMGAQVFMSGLEDEWLNTARVTLSRLDPEAELLGPIQASQVYLGDLSPVDLPVLGRPGIERGAAVSNRDLNRSSDFDTTRFEGNMQPGWDVELYRNDVLVESMRVRGDGRYIFDEVPVFFGGNSFRILAFGPQGQRRVVEEKNINVGSGMLPAGDFEYNLSATQRKNTILGIDERTSPATDDGARLNGKFGYGLNDNLSLTSGLSSVEFEGTRHNYLQGGVSGSYSSFYGQADYIYDTESGSGLSLFGQAALGPFNIKGKHESYYDFIEETRPNSFLESKNSFWLDGNITNFPFFGPLSYTLSTENTTYTDSEVGRVSAKLAGRIQSVYLSNVLNWNYTGANKDNGRLIDGDFQAVGSVGRGRINAGLRYAIGDLSEISQYRLSGQWPIIQDLTAGASLVHYAGENERTSARVNLDWDTGRALLSPSVSYDTDGGFGAFLTLSFSLGRDPISEEVLMRSTRRSGKGATTALVYHDANNNRVFDQEDTPLPDVEVVARQARKKSLTNDNGVAHFTDLNAFEPTDVEVDVETLEDPFWQPALAGTAVVPRAGSVKTLEFPVVTTGEIDGTVYSVDVNGARQQLSNVQLEIVDGYGAVVQTVNSEYDGFYLFEKVFPGTYTLRVSNDDSRNIDPTAGLQVEIVIENDGTITSGNDLILQAPPGEALENISPPVVPPSVDTSSDAGDLAEAVAPVSKPVIEAISSITTGPMRNKENRDDEVSVPKPAAGPNEPPAFAAAPLGKSERDIASNNASDPASEIAEGNVAIFQVDPGRGQSNISAPLIPSSINLTSDTYGLPETIPPATAPVVEAASTITIRPMRVEGARGNEVFEPTPLPGQDVSSTSTVAPFGSSERGVTTDIASDRDSASSGENDAVLHADPNSGLSNAPAPLEPSSVNQSSDANGLRKAIPPATAPAAEAASTITIRPMTIQSTTGNETSASIPVSSRVSAPEPLNGQVRPLTSIGNSTNRQENVSNLTPVQSASAFVSQAALPEEQPRLRPGNASRGDSVDRRSAIDRIPSQVIQPFVSIGRPIELDLPINNVRRRLAIQSSFTPVVRQPALVSRFNERRHQPPVTEAVRSRDMQPQDEQGKHFGVHLASYRSREAARTGVKVLQESLGQMVSPGEFSIVKVDLGEEMGIWYRVVYGNFGQKKDADILAGRIQPKTEYAKSIAVDSTSSVSVNPAKFSSTQRSQTGTSAIIVGKYAAMQKRE